MREQTVFPADVLLEIHRRTEGIPRLINSVCDNLLLTSFAMESRKPTWKCWTKFRPISTGMARQAGSAETARTSL